MSSCVDSEQTALLSRSLIPLPLLNCIEFYAVLFKRTSYLEGGRVICEAKKVVKNDHIFLQYGTHRHLHQGVNDSKFAQSTYNVNELRFLDHYEQPRCYVIDVMTKPATALLKHL